MYILKEKEQKLGLEVLIVVDFMRYLKKTIYSIDFNYFPLVPFL